ncbi:homocysteine S-methyltransferase [Thermoleophilia bacterium SCSIO 60948]|nr:homocysteine S-methyltransferase [Thermoleophilia bacterium SCSIO 60948]
MGSTDALPQLEADRLYLTDGGIETVLIFHEGVDLPLFAAFGLLGDESGEQTLRRYYAPYLELAHARGLGFVLESPTWRASPRWATELGYDAATLDRLNRRAITLLQEIRDEASDAEQASRIVISGCIGPRGDGYDPSERLEPDQARAYHAVQIASFAAAGADMVTAITMTHVEEAIGVANAAAAAGIPSAISFTVETDGRLPTGQPLGEAIEQVDAATASAPAYFMINCAHPKHFEPVLDTHAAWSRRIHGVRANASELSHAELDESEELDPGDPEDLGRRYAALREILPALSVVGGCCGTDHRHVEKIRDALLASG